MHGLEEFKPEENGGNDNDNDKELDQMTRIIIVHLHQRCGYDQYIKDTLEYKSEQPVTVSNRVPKRRILKKNANVLIIVCSARIWSGINRR